MDKTEVLLETCLDTDGTVAYQIARNTMTGEYYFYAEDDDGKLKKKAKSYHGSFEKEKQKYGPSRE